MVKNCVIAFKVTTETKLALEKFCLDEDINKSEFFNEWAEAIRKNDAFVINFIRWLLKNKNGRREK